MRWRLHEDTQLLDPALDSVSGNAAEQLLALPDTAQWQGLKERLAWAYPFMAATSRPAKTSVTLLRRHAAEELPEAELSPFAVPVSQFRPPASPSGAREGLSAAEIGTAHHTFLQLVALSRVGSLEGLRQEARRLEQAQTLTAQETAVLNIEGVAAFWSSELGRRIQEQARFARRELAFTARFSPNELATLTGAPANPGLEDEFVVVQGVADLAVILPEEIWLVDFKTDVLRSADLSEKLRCTASNQTL